jgi:hypothetical protein
MAAFGAAAGQHFASVGALHALAKTVYGFAAAAVGLKCAFHLFQFFLVQKSPGENQAFKLHRRVTTPLRFCERTAKVRAKAETRES